MSFDLCVWREEQPITANQAKEVYLYLQDAGEPGVELDVRPDARVGTFYTELMERHPALETLGIKEGEASPWSMTPFETQESVTMCMGYRESDTVAPEIIELAGKHGLVCYNPQKYRVHNPGEIVDDEGLHLVFFDGGTVNRPKPVELRSLLESLSPRNWYTILLREPQTYVQVGIGEFAGGLAKGQFGLEYRQGDADHHFRVVTSSFDEVVTVFESFAAGSDAFKTASAWEHISFS